LAESSDKEGDAVTRRGRASVLRIAVTLLSAVACRPGAASAEKALHIAQDAPAVLQRSPMDCGPAALQSVLQGFGVQVDYERLVGLLAVDPREGASIDTVEEVANRLGVRAEQVMLPVDHLFLPGAEQGPMIAVARGSGTSKHFLVLWRTSGEQVELMDPATGFRTWVAQSDLRKRLFVHQMAVSAKEWREWSRGESFHQCLLERMRRLGMPASANELLWAEALDDLSNRGLQALDAAVRLAAVGPRETDVSGQVRRVFECSKNPFCSGKDQAPNEFWSAWNSGANSAGEAQVTIRGVVLVLFSGGSPIVH
jgi:Peptidase C39 family